MIYRNRKNNKALYISILIYFEFCIEFILNKFYNFNKLKFIVSNVNKSINLHLILYKNESE